MNILFITADEWRGECLSALGHAHAQTPHLDAIAADGVTFKRHFAQATPCGPSRTCLYTGMYMLNHRSVLSGTPLDGRHTNVALEARKAGYEPALFGYTDISLDPRQHPDDVLKSYEGVLPGMDPVTHLRSDWKPWLAYLEAEGYRIPENPMAMFAPRAPCPGTDNKGKTFAPAIFKAEDSNTKFLVDEAINYLSERYDPWFVHLSFLSPHPPFIVAEPYNEMFDAEDMPLPVRQATPEIEAAQHPWLEYYLHNQRGSGYTFGAAARDNLSLSETELRQMRATYFAMLSEVDAQIGRLMDYLKQAGAYDDTMIIFTSDHGSHLGDHWMLSKYTYFDQTFHIPLIVRDPTPGAGPGRGAVVEAFTESVDIMPTILEGIGVDIPSQCNGHSLMPFCRGERPDGWRHEYHAEFDLRSPYQIEEAPPLGLEPQQCTVNIICGDRYKYVHFATLPHLFFDREEDPNEFHDLAADHAYQGRVAEYAGKMLSWRMENDDPALTDLHLTSDGVKSGLRSR
jgi:arylsulfatase A-like enzyme